MADKTRIEWAANADGTPGATWNPIRARDRETGRVGTFCVHATAGCVNCYAETFQQRTLPNNGIGLPYTAQNLDRVEHFIDENMLTAPLRRRKPTTWFLSSMTDVFGEWVPDDMLDRLFAVMALCPQHLFIIVTKRTARAREYMTAIANEERGILRFFKDLLRPLVRRKEDSEHVLNARLDDAFLDACNQITSGLRGDPQIPHPTANVWLVASCEDQANADARIPDLLATPAAVRGVSCEPLIGPIDLTKINTMQWHRAERVNALTGELSGMFGDPAGITTRLDWAIAGGESGPNARPMHPDWARKLRDDCAAAGVPFFFKQWGEWLGGETCDHGAAVGFKDAAIHGSPIHWSGAHLHFFDEAATHPKPAAIRLGKQNAGRLLDGRTHDERPPFSHLQSVS